MSQFFETQNNSVVSQPVLKIQSVYECLEFLSGGFEVDMFPVESRKFLVRFCNQTQPIYLGFLFLNKLGSHYFLRSLHSLGRDVKISMISDF